MVRPKSAPPAAARTLATALLMCGILAAAPVRAAEAPAPAAAPTPVFEQQPASIAMAPAGSQAVNTSDTITAVLNAMMLGPDAPARTITVRLTDDSDMHRQMQERFEVALAARGYQVLRGEEAVGSALVLEFDTASSKAPQRLEQGSLVSMRANVGESESDDQVEGVINVFSNTEASLIGGPVEHAMPSLGGPMLRLDVGLTDRATGRRLWQGWATAGSPSLGRDVIALSLVDPLSATLGKSVRAQKVTVAAVPAP